MKKMTNQIALLATTAIAFPLAFDNRSGWKMDGDKIAVDGNGNPIYVKEDGSEQAVEQGTISRLNAEAKSHRERAEKAEAAIKAFEGLDPAKAREALDALGKIDQKKLIDAGEVDKVKDAISKQYEAQLAETRASAEKLQSTVNDLQLGRAFDRSQFINERIAVPRDMFENQFRNNFKYEDGKIVPYDAHGNKVFSKKRMGEIADVDEALEIIVEAYPHRDGILKAPNAGGGGSGNGGGGGARGGGRTIRRADFDALPPHQKAESAQLAAKGEMTIVD